MDSGIEKIEDDAIKRVVRKQARKVHLESLALAAVITLAIVLIPA